MGVMLSAGGSLRWFRDRLGMEEKNLASLLEKDSYDILTAEAEKALPGAEGLIFLPYLTGERTPHADPYARGVFFGLTLKHRKNEMVRAVMEGVTFGMRDSFEIMREMNIPIQEVRAIAVSYTHLDVYKRQHPEQALNPTPPDKLILPDLLIGR